MNIVTLKELPKASVKHLADIMDRESRAGWIRELEKLGENPVALAGVPSVDLARQLVDLTD